MSTCASSLCSDGDANGGVNEIGLQGVIVLRLHALLRNLHRQKDLMFKNSSPKSCVHGGEGVEQNV